MAAVPPLPRLTFCNDNDPFMASDQVSSPQSSSPWVRRLMQRPDAHQTVPPAELGSFVQRMMALPSYGFYEWWPAKKLFRYSENFGRLLGYRSYELPLNESSIAAHMEAEDRLRVGELMMQAAAQGTDVCCEFRMHSKSGELRWYQHHLIVLSRNEAGGIEHAVGSLTDVDAVIRARQQWQARARSEQWLSETIQALVRSEDSSAFEKCLNSLCEHFDIDHASFRHVEEGEERFSLLAIGHHSSQSAPLALYRTVRPDDLEGALPLMLRGESLYIDDLNARDLNNGTQQLSVRRRLGIKSIAFIPFFYQGQFEYYLSLMCTRRAIHWTPALKRIASVVADTLSMAAARQRIAMALSENEERFQQVLDATQDGIWDWDLREQRFFVSPSFLYMLGYDEELVPLTAEKIEQLLIPPTTLADFFMEHPRPAKPVAGTLEFSAHLRHRDGSAVPVLVRGKQTGWNSDGSACACVGAITELRSLQNTRERRPLARRPSTNARTFAFANSSQEVVKFDTADFFAELSAELSTLAAAEGVAFTSQISVALPDYLYGSAERLAGVVRVLVTAAIHRGAGANIKLSATMMGSGRDWLDLLIAVEDEGPRLGEDLMASLMGASVSADLDEVWREAAQCLVWVREQQGVSDIRAGSGGNRYAFTLPLSRLSPEQRLHEQRLGNQQGGAETAKSALDEDVLMNSRILLAEDNTINQQVATGFLRRRGVRVTVVNNGQEAVELLEKSGPGSFDLVLMDMEMPHMDGYEAAQRLRRSRRFDELPIIALTAHAMQEDRDKCLDAGMNDHLAKPVRPELLYATLSKHLQSR